MSNQILTFELDLPSQVEFGEHGGLESTSTEVRYDAPPGYTVDLQGLALHWQALAYAEQYKTDYFTAVMKLS
jgi:hypothetical protein